MMENNPIQLICILFSLIFLAGIPIAWALSQIEAERGKRLFKKLLQEERKAKGIYR